MEIKKNKGFPYPPWKVEDGGILGLTGLNKEEDGLRFIYFFIYIF